MVRLCFLIRHLNQGGAQRQLLELVKGLDKTRYDVTIITFYDGGIFWDEAKAIEGATLVSLQKRGRWDLGPFFLRLWGTVKRLSPDLLCSYLGVSNIISALLGCWLPATKVVWSIRSSDVQLEGVGRLARLLFRIELLLSRNADAIIFNSSFGHRSHREKGFCGKGMVVVPNGIDTGRFAPGDRSANAVRAELGIADGQRVIGIIGRLDPLKDYHTFLRAAARLLRDRNDLWFVCVGDGPESYKAQLHALARELGIQHRIFWIGLRGDMPSVYGSLDFLVSSSTSEGFPNVIGEAMASGVPCVVTDVGDSALIVGDVGGVVPPGSPEALAAGMSEMLRRIERSGGTLRQASRDRIVHHFSIASLVLNTTAVYDSLICSG